MCLYDEKLSMISRSIESALPIIDTLVVADGAYASFPSGEARSPVDQIDLIQRICREREIDLILHQPSEVWADGEPEKRDHLFHLADTTGADWYVVLDTDFVFEYRRGVPVVLERLRDATLDCGEIVLENYLRPDMQGPAPEIGPPIPWQRNLDPLPLFYRGKGAPRIRIGPTHYHTKREGDSTHTWGCSNTPQLPRFKVPLLVHHEWWKRDDPREIKKWTYYFQRDQAQLETSPFAT